MLGQELMQEQMQEPRRTTASWLVQLPFLNSPGLPASGWYSPQWVRPSHVNHQSSKCWTDMLTGQSDGDITSSQVCLCLCQVDKNSDNPSIILALDEKHLNADYCFRRLRAPHAWNGMETQWMYSRSEQCTHALHIWIKGMDRLLKVHFSEFIVVA